MKRPAFQFYPADWRNNAKLRRCSPAARGVWMDVLCVLHDSDEYGICRWPLSDLANASGAAIKLIRELVEKQVLKGADKNAVPYVYTPRHAGKDGDPVVLVEPGAGPCWYSSRFVRDEWIRQRRGSGTQFTAENQPPNKAPKPAPKAAPMGGLGGRQGDGSSSSSSSSIKDREKSTRKPRAASLEISLTEYLERCKADGTMPIPADHAIRAYCVDAGIADEMRQIAWLVFKDRHLSNPKAKKYTDWPAAFANSVKDRWYRLWNVDAQGSTVWSANGLQEKLVIEKRMNDNKEPDHAPA